MRIGLYSGTFDPIHEGHVLFGQVAAEQYGLDKIYLIPEDSPRHKQDVSDIDDRRAMITLATYAFQIFEHFRSSHPQHTYQGILEEVGSVHPEDELFMLVGHDVFVTMPEWGKRDDELGTPDEYRDNLSYIVGLRNLSEIREARKVANTLGLNAGFIEVPLSKISSSNIRKAVQNKQQPYGLNDDVETYIKKRGLYL